MSAAIDYSIRQAEKHNKRGDINTAKAVIEKAIQKYPDNPRLRLAARRLDKKGNAPLRKSHTIAPEAFEECEHLFQTCLLYTSPSPRDQRGSRMPSSA